MTAATAAGAGTQIEGRRELAEATQQQQLLAPVSVCVLPPAFPFGSTDPLATMLQGSSMHLVSGSASELLVQPVQLWFEAGPLPTSRLGIIAYSIDAEGSSPQERHKREGQCIALERLCDVFLGAQQPLFRCPAAIERAFDSARCFSLVSKALTMHLVAETADDRNTWLRGIKERFLTSKQQQRSNRTEAAGAGAGAAAAAAAAAAASVPARNSPPNLSILKPLLIAGHRMHRLSQQSGGELSIKPVYVWWQHCDASSDVSPSSRGRALGELCWVDCPLDAAAAAAASPTALEVLKLKVVGQALPLHRISDVFLGSQRPIFRNAAASFASECCFTLDAAVSRGGGGGGGGGCAQEINLVASSQAEREVWVQGIKAMFAEVKRGRNAAKEHGMAAVAAAAMARAASPSSPAASPARAPGGPSVNEDADSAAAAAAATAAAAVDLQGVVIDVPASAASSVATTASSSSSAAASASASPCPSPSPALPALPKAASAAAAPYFSEPRSFLSVVLDPSAPGGIGARTIWLRHVPSASAAGADASGAGSLCWSSSPRAATSSASGFDSGSASASSSSSLDLSAIKHIRVGASSPTLRHAVKYESISLVPIDASAAFSLLDASEQAGLHLLAPSHADRKAAVQAIKDIFEATVRRQQQMRRQSGEQAAAAVVAAPAAPVPAAAAAPAADPQQQHPMVISEGAVVAASGASPSNSNAAVDSSQPGRLPEKQLQQPQREIQAPRQKRKKTLWQKLTCSGAEYEDQ